MIISIEVNIKTTNKTYKHYKNLGYIFECNDFINVKAEHLSYGSHEKIEMSCDICSKHRIIQFRGITDKEKFSYICASCSAKERVNKFGTLWNDPEFQRKNANKQTSSSFDKRRATKLIKYGSETYNNADKRIQMMELNGISCGRSKFFFHDYFKISYQGSYEGKFLDHCQNIGIKKIERPKGISYKWQGNLSQYRPDFLLDDLYIEIKSLYTYNIDIERNLVKRDAILNLGYDFIFIIDNDFSEFQNRRKEDLSANSAIISP